MTRACVFDVNETLLDMGALDQHFECIFGDSGARQVWFGQFLQLWLTETVTGVYQEFGAIGGAALKMLAEERGVEISDDEVGEILGSMKEMPPHPEVEDGLSRLREAGFRLATHQLHSAVRRGLDRELRPARVLRADPLRRQRAAPEAGPRTLPHGR